MYSFPNFEPAGYSMSRSNCCFLTCIQVSQETGKVIWYSNFFKNFPQFVVIHMTKGSSVVSEAKVRTEHGTMDWFQFGKGVRRGCILSPCLFNIYAEYIMRNVWLDESQAGIKIPGRNINKLRYGDTILMAESKEELKSLLIKVKEKSEKAGLKLHIKKKLRSWHLVPSLHGK